MAEIEKDLEVCIGVNLSITLPISHFSNFFKSVQFFCYFLLDVICYLIGCVVSTLHLANLFHYLCYGQSSSQWWSEFSCFENSPYVNSPVYCLAFTSCLILLYCLSASCPLYQSSIFRVNHTYSILAPNINLPFCPCQGHFWMHLFISTPFSFRS